MKSKSRIFWLSIQKRKEVAQETTEIVFDIEIKDFSFKSGQYIRISIPELKEEIIKGNTRDFSIASSPSVKDAITIVFRNSNSPFKKYLLAAPLGTRVKAQGPLGIFTLPEDQTIPIVVIAGGMGITPALSMLRLMEANHTQRQMQVVYMNTTQDRAAYVEELKQIAATKPGIKLIKKLGRADATWIKNHVTYTDKTLWYLCGNPDMVLNFVQTLSNTLKISECNFYTEEYPGYRAMQTEYKIWPPIEEEVVILSEEALLEESFIRALLQATGQGALISITDLQGKIIYANDKFVQVSKYSREELLGENHRILKSGIHPPEIYADMWKTISSNHLWRGEIKNRAKDGSFYWVDASILSVTFRGGMRRYLAVRYLITDKKMLEVSEKELLATLNQLQSMSREKDFLKALHQSEEKFRSFVETTNSWVWEMDIFGKYTYSNPTSQKILGYDLKELLGKEIFALAVEAEKIKKEMGDCICLQKGWSDRLWQVKSRGGSSLWLESSGNPILNEKGTLIGFRGTDHDVTDRIRIDQLKNEFISMVSHELRTPLTSIVGALGVIGAKKDLSTELDDLISIASRNADRLVHIINDILDIERIQLGKLELKLELLFLDRLVQETINLSRPMAIANQITLVEEKIFPSVRIMADSNRLAQVMFNLLSNAIKFSHPGGKVTVRMESRGEIIRVAVEDLGKGIPAEMQKKIFEKFSQIEGGDIHVKGTGLGLNISKSLVEQMGGKIGFNSAANLGSTFYFEFPIVKDG